MNGLFLDIVGPITRSRKKRNNVYEPMVHSNPPGLRRRSVCGPYTAVWVDPVLRTVRSLKLHRIGPHVVRLRLRITYHLGRTVTESRFHTVWHHIWCNYAILRSVLLGPLIRSYTEPYRLTWAVLVSPLINDHSIDPVMSPIRKKSLDENNPLLSGKYNLSKHLDVIISIL